MCRYAYKTYKEHFACFHCRKVFRQLPAQDLPESARPASNAFAQILARKAPCPECGGPMDNVGKDFKTPRRENVVQWRKARLLYRNGLHWHNCGCGGSLSARTLSEAKALVENRKRQAERVDFPLSAEVSIRP